MSINKSTAAVLLGRHETLGEALGSLLALRHLARMTRTAAAAQAAQCQEAKISAAVGRGASVRAGSVFARVLCDGRVVAVMAETAI